MGFWGKLGRGLLKAAPIAAAFIPGIGPIASMALQAGLGAANAKAGGAGWKGTLLGAGLGGATSGLGPSSSFIGKNVGSVANKALGGGGFWGTAGNIAKQTGKQMLGDKLGGFGGGDNYRTPSYFPEGQGGGGIDWSSLIGKGIDAFGNRRGSQQGQNQGQGQDEGLGPSDQSYGRMENRTPNLEDYFNQGRQEGLYDSGRQPYPEEIYGGVGGYRRFQNQPYRGNGGGRQRRGQRSGKAIPRSQQGVM